MKPTTPNVGATALSMAGAATATVWPATCGSAATGAPAAAVAPVSSAGEAEAGSFARFALVADQVKGKKLRSGGRLADVAPTALELMGLAKPAEMTGESLIEK